MFEAGRQLAAAIRKSDLRCGEINLFLADGEAALQEIFHIHLHVLPGERATPSGCTPVSVPAARQELDAVAAQVRWLV